MMEENIITQQITENKRPMGVWILTIYALVFTGILPLILSLFVLFSGNAGTEMIGILFSFPISVGVITSAIGAWKGREKARKSLLIFVTLHYVLIAINNFIFINSGQVPDGQQIRFWGRVIRGFLYPAVYIWYFNKYTTKEFFRQ